MILGRLKRDTKWNYGISFEPDYRRFNRLAKIFAVWCFKLRTLPDLGTDINGMDFKGFWYRKEIMTRWNIIVRTKTFRVPYWIKITKD